MTRKFKPSSGRRTRDGSLKRSKLLRLTEEQHRWISQQSNGSDLIRAMITEAMNRDLESKSS